MSILKSTKRADYKHVGAALPSHDCNFLAAYAVAQGESKSQIIKQLVEQLESNVVHEDIVLRIAEKLKEQWDLKIIKTPKQLYSFHLSFKNELEKKGLSNMIISEIIITLNGIKNGTN